MKSEVELVVNCFVFFIPKNQAKTLMPSNKKRKLKLSQPLIHEIARCYSGTGNLFCSDTVKSSTPCVNSACFFSVLQLTVQ